MNPFNRMRRSRDVIYGTAWMGDAGEQETFIVKWTTRDAPHILEPLEVTDEAPAEWL